MSHKLLREVMSHVVLIALLVIPTAAESSQVLNVAEMLDFQVDADRDAKLLIKLDTRNVVIKSERQDEKLWIELTNITMVESDALRLDVKEFGTLVSHIDVQPTSQGVGFLLAIEGKYEYHHQLRDGMIVITLEPDEQATKQQDNHSQLSMNFQDIDLRRALYWLAEFSDINLVLSDNVQGRLSLRLQSVPWSQVLDVILQLKQLSKQVEGNVMVIAPRDELPASGLLNRSQLGSQVIEVQYAKVTDLANMINGEHSGLLSDQGSLAFDERTNTLVVHDYPQQRAEIQKMVDALDVAVKQVQIEARIVSLNQGSLEELGVRWGVMSQQQDYSIAGSIEANQSPSSGENLAFDQRLNVNLGATAANTSSIAFQIATLGSNTLLDLELSALQSESKAEIISSPSLLTTNKQPAYIEQGTEIPYVEAASSGATAVKFKKAVLSLKVTPQITPNNKLILDLNVTQDRPGEVVKTGTGEAVAIQTQRIGTQVLVASGETVVLGGIYQHSVSDTVDKVPLLGDLPLVGALFRRSYQKMGKSELLIFVTPKVVIQ
ncbi:type IV pilus secretin PilQ [Vibrio sp. AK197]